jgi:hypothetical protein
MKYFIAFANNEFKNQGERLKKQADSTGWFDRVIIENKESIANFYDTHKEFIDANNRGYGYWIWKPYIIHRLLSNIDYDDYIFYTDTGASIIPHKYNRLLEYINLLNNSNRPIITFSAQYPEKYFQKLSVLKHFNLSSNTDFLDSYQTEGGVFICKKTDFVVHFVKTWLDLVLYDNYKLVIDSIDNEEELMGFLEHRHDQSILSILCKEFGTNIICCNEAYGSGPFFSSRLTDGLPRRFAPDLFRTDIRYDENRHFTWSEWLFDYPDSKFNYDILIQNLPEIS